MADMNERVKQYIALRDKIKATEEEHKAALKPLKDLLGTIGGVLQEFMEANKSEGIKTEYGTCYLTVKYHASLADSAVFQKFVKETGKYDLLDWKANSTAVRDFVQEHKNLPPGVNLSSIQTIGVRRS